MSYKKLNDVLGWCCFAAALLVYFLTLERSVSYWDSGEFIAAAYKLQIVHQPGAPLYLMLAKIFSLFAGSDRESVAFWMNISSATVSAATIMFLFWTITALAFKVLHKNDSQLTTAKLITILGSGLTGAFAFTFSDSFWFSAVESEVYALSSLCTAVVVWALLKWDRRADEPGSDRWLVFLAYMMGLSIGVHLLNLLTIPAIALFYYFRKTSQSTFKGIVLSTIAGAAILIFIQYGIIQYTVKFAGFSDLFFVNTVGLPFGSGVLVFSLLVILSLAAGLVYTLNAKKSWLYIAAGSFVLLMMLGGGFTGLVFAGLVLAGLEYGLKIRQKRYALNLALISTVFILFGFGSFAMIVIRADANPTLNNYHASDAFSLSGYVNREQYVKPPLFYGPYFDSKPIEIQKGETVYRKGKDKYEAVGPEMKRVYDRNTLMPRLHSDDPKHVAGYRQWLGITPSESPVFLDNLKFLFGHQIGFMYIRYFAWNFIGRQNDVQGEGDHTSGNWLSGVKPVDNLMLGGQYDLPSGQTANKAFNKFYFLPFLLGILGLYWHYRKTPKDAAIVGLLFISTGLAIILFLNQTPGEPRERDYAYTGSFYTFAIWIGLGVAGLVDFLSRRIKARTAAMAASFLGLLIAPFLMASEGWDDHDRSSRTSARDMAYNYLDTCAPNAILFTYGDNDTYPLWYAQEVEGYRTDVRLVNLSLLNADWYIRQQKLKVNEAEGLPITMPDEKFVKGVRDALAYQDYGIPGHVELKEVFAVLTSDSEGDKVEYQDGSRENFLPTKNFKLSIDKEQVISSKTLPARRKSEIADSIEWTFPKNFVTKGELALFDILAANNWERPIYFTTTMPTENYLGLDKYLYNEGFAYRLLPLKPQLNAPEDQPEAELVNTDVMFENMVNKFRWGSFKGASYLDPESRRMSLTIINHFNTLAQSLYEQGRQEDARKALLKCIKYIPDTNYSMNFTLRKLYMADLLYKVNETQEANKLASNTGQYISEELKYLAAVAKMKDNLNVRDVQMGAYVVGELAALTARNGQEELSKKLQGQMAQMEAEFIGRF